jgi:hypothetical protein
LISNSSNSFNPKFKNPDKNQFNLLIGSSVIGNANLSFSTFADITGNSRATSSDIGAYEYLP